VRLVRPMALIRGELIVGDPDRFHAMLVVGIGRHVAFVYGMVFLSPPSCAILLFSTAAWVCLAHGYPMCIAMYCCGSREESFMWKMERFVSRLQAAKTFPRATMPFLIRQFQWCSLVPAPA